MESDIHFSVRELIDQSPPTPGPSGSSGMNQQDELKSGDTQPAQQEEPETEASD